MDRFDFGPDCIEILDELSQDIEANKEVIQEIRQNCLDFYVEAASQIVERLDYIHDEFYKKLSVTRIKL